MVKGEAIRDKDIQAVRQPGGGEVLLVPKLPPPEQVKKKQPHIILLGQDVRCVIEILNILLKVCTYGNIYRDQSIK